MFTHVFAFRVT